MIGAEAKIAEAYHALKQGDAANAIRLLEGIAHPRAKALLEQAEAVAKRPNCSNSE